MRHGKPTKNKKRRDPRYYLNEQGFDADELSARVDAANPGMIQTASTSEADITGVIKSKSGIDDADYNTRAAVAAGRGQELPWDYDPAKSSDIVNAYASDRMKAGEAIFTGDMPPEPLAPDVPTEPEAASVKTPGPEEIKPESEGDEVALNLAIKNAEDIILKAASIHAPAGVARGQGLTEIINDVFKRILHEETEAEQLAGDPIDDNLLGGFQMPPGHKPAKYKIPKKPDVDTLVKLDPNLPDRTQSRRTFEPELTDPYPLGPHADYGQVEPGPWAPGKAPMKYVPSKKSIKRYEKEIGDEPVDLGGTGDFYDPLGSLEQEEYPDQSVVHTVDRPAGFQEKWREKPGQSGGAPIEPQDQLQPAKRRGGVYLADPAYSGYGTEEMQDKLKGLQHVGGGDWWVGDISLKSGGDIKGHGTHEKGTVADIALPTTGGGSTYNDPKTYKGKKPWGDNKFRDAKKDELDIPKATAFVRYMMDQGARRVLLDQTHIDRVESHMKNLVAAGKASQKEYDRMFKPVGKDKLPRFRHKSKHGDHFHVNFHPQGKKKPRALPPRSTARQPPVPKRDEMYESLIKDIVNTVVNQLANTSN